MLTDDGTEDGGVSTRETVQEVDHAVVEGGDGRAGDEEHERTDDRGTEDRVDPEGDEGAHGTVGADVGLHPPHEEAGDETGEHAAEEAGRDGVGSEAADEAGPETWLVSQRVGHEGREDGDHEGSEGAGAEGLEEVEPARLVGREILEAEGLGDDGAEGCDHAAGDNDGDDVGDAGEDRVLDEGTERHLGAVVLLDHGGGVGGGDGAALGHCLLDELGRLLDAGSRRGVDLGQTLEAVAVLDGDVVSEDDRLRAGDVRVGDAVLDARRSLGLDLDLDARLLCRLLQTFGCHVRVGYARRASSHAKDERLLL